MLNSLVLVLSLASAGIAATLSPINKSSDIASVSNIQALGPVTITNVTFKGSGCPAAHEGDGTLYDLSYDKRGLTFTFNEYQASIGPDVPSDEKKKRCHVILDLEISQGFNFLAESFTHRGTIRLDEGVTATQNTTYWTRKKEYSQTIIDDFTGPIEEENFGFMHQFDLTDTAEECTKEIKLHIATEFTLDNSAKPEASGFIGMDSLGNTVTQTIHIPTNPADCL